MMRRRFRARSTLARWAAAPDLVMLHVVRGLVELGEATLGKVVMLLSPFGAARALKRRDQQRRQDGGRWFTAEESALVEILARFIVPSDETGPGADQMGSAGRSSGEKPGDLVESSPPRPRLYCRGVLALGPPAQPEGQAAVRATL